LNRRSTKVNVASKKKDLLRVKAILHALQSGDGFDVASDTIKNQVGCPPMNHQFI